MTYTAAQERALARARAARLPVTGPGVRKADGRPVYAVPSQTEANRYQVVCVEGQYVLSCDCKASQRGQVCIHRATVHQYLADGLRAATGRP
jgi:hypothetical protein